MPHFVRLKKKFTRNHLILLVVLGFLFSATFLSAGGAMIWLLEMRNGREGRDRVNGFDIVGKGIESSPLAPEVENWLKGIRSHCRQRVAHITALGTPHKRHHDCSESGRSCAAWPV